MVIFFFFIFVESDEATVLFSSDDVRRSEIGRLRKQNTNGC